MSAHFFRALNTAGVEFRGVIDVRNGVIGPQLIKQQGMFLSKFEPLYGDIYRVRGRFPDGKAGVRYFEADSLDSLLRSLRTATIRELSRVMYYCGRAVLPVKTIGLRGMKKRRKKEQNRVLPGCVRFTGSRLHYRYKEGQLRPYWIEGQDIFRVERLVLPLSDVHLLSADMIEQLFVIGPNGRWISG